LSGICYTHSNVMRVNIKIWNHSKDKMEFLFLQFQRKAKRRTFTCCSEMFRVSYQTIFFKDSKWLQFVSNFFRDLSQFFQQAHTKGSVKRLHCKKFTKRKDFITLRLLKLPLLPFCSSSSSFSL